MPQRHGFLSREGWEKNGLPSYRRRKTGAAPRGGVAPFFGSDIGAHHDRETVGAVQRYGTHA